jgi:hypothetical protein
MTCKHNWHFTSETSLACTRCGAETGPRSYDQRVQDLMQEPRAWYTVSEINDWAVQYLDKHKEQA